MTPAQRDNLRRLLSPRHIAFVGGRDCLTAMGEAARRGFKGAIWPVNPSRAQMRGHPCFASIDDLPEAPDAVFLAVPALAAIEVTRGLSQRGAGGIVCYSAGFREAGGDGAAMEAALVEAAGDLALIGPNCYGAINYLSNTALWPFAHGGGCPNGFGAAIITQSGMLSSDITMSQRGLPLTHMISCGNQAALSLEDYLDFLIDEPGVRAVGLHIEGLRSVARFHDAALRANARGIPVVALKSGASRIGAALTVSHTGSLSGSDALYDALFARCGVIRVETPPELMETLKFLVLGGVPSANRVAGFTCSGGGAAMLADWAEKIGLTFPPVPDANRAALATLLPTIATVSNPLDYTTPIWGDPVRTGPVFAEAMDQTDAAAAVLVQDYPAPGLDESQVYYRSDAGALIAAAKARGLPVAVLATLHENMDPATRDWLVAQGCAPLLGISEGLGAVRAAIWWGERRNAIAKAPPAPLHPARTGPLRALTEAESKANLAAGGLPVPVSRSSGLAGIMDATRDLRFPVALKMIGPRLAHKSEAGAVALGLADPGAVIAAAGKMTAAVAAHDPLAVTDQFLIEEMVPKPAAELLVSLRRDPEFGPALTIAAGGVLVELLQDSVNLLLPASPDDIGAALASLRLAPLLDGYRGAAGADRAALVATIDQLQALFLDDSDLFEIEINPLFAGPTGTIIVDALIHTLA
ncbi:COG1042 Acyl-CoA synthetase (NDP forming) [Paracoccaceae bacterium]|jgi:acyl-CoA synthetase (NDP forming)